MSKLYRYSSPYDTGLWVESKKIATDWLQEYLDNADLENFDMNDCCHLESIELGEINTELEIYDQTKVEETYMLIKDESIDEDPRELGYDFDFYVKWEKIETEQVKNGEKQS